ncbi:hypothetical protein EPUS_08784 [Endocarpon pusillum Z07020]|uniref:Enoyl reductase (ER) domain-containing protein n=1 Tax=Endocarpon pusillum (strain Z07020 / HMAS-L-300199) TaxID=1263415 RepID=U1HJF7_ENDPU|nr:uncharacterized protein EPUS_08784 [Endocarpon pusillum Z07020]ERF70360.1 hypothetical protein EPUS_08784 [Endocarpon pusillum Z07020]
MATSTTPIADSSLPSTAKTVIYDLPTRTLHLQPNAPIPTPDPTKGDHLIRVQTTALCARELDWPFLYPDAIFSDNPEKLIIPGYDLGGTVVTSPPGSHFQPGDEIYARTPASRPGNCREYTIARTGEMALKPKSTDWVETACVPLSVLTAWQALFVHGGIEAEGLVERALRGSGGSSKKRVLVTAAAGAVGVWLVQLARIAGCEVVAQIGSLENDKFIRSFGASQTINYKEVSLKQWVEMDGNNEVDIAIDLIGGKTLEECWYCVKDGGTLISIIGPPETRKPDGWEEMREGKKDVKSVFFIMEPIGSQLTEVSKLIDEGQCKPVLDSVWDLEETEKAFERLNSGNHRGKIVVKIAQ